MNDQTLKALRESIAHWQRLSEAKTRDEIKNEGMGCEVCALCDRFLKYGIPDNCDGCPVRDRTGKPGCRGTPYEDADTLYDTVVIEGEDLISEFKHAARAELEFLQSLLPKEWQC